MTDETPCDAQQVSQTFFYYRELGWPHHLKMCPASEYLKCFIVSWLTDKATCKCAQYVSLSASLITIDDRQGQPIYASRSWVWVFHHEPDRGWLTTPSHMSSKWVRLHVILRAGWPSGTTCQCAQGVSLSAWHVYIASWLADETICTRTQVVSLSSCFITGWMTVESITWQGCESVCSIPDKNWRDHLECESVIVFLCELNDRQGHLHII